MATGKNYQQDVQGRHGTQKKSGGMLGCIIDIP